MTLKTDTLRINFLRILHLLREDQDEARVAVHLVWDGPDPDAFIDQITDALADNHAIFDVTLQLERRLCDRQGSRGLLSAPL